MLVAILGIAVVLALVSGAQYLWRARQMEAAVSEAVEEPGGIGRTATAE